MNPRLVLALWSFRREIKLVFIVLVSIICLPFLGVILITQIGVNVISDSLVGNNAVTKTIILKDPRTGEVYKEIKGNVAWPSVGRTTLEFGELSPFQPFHTGLDIASKLNTPVTPMMGGTVIYARENFFGYGKHVIIDHGDNITAIYAHLNKIYATEGQKVTVNDVIGGQGKTGWATGVHLHFEIRVFGIPVNPMVFLSNG